MQPAKRNVSATPSRHENFTLLAVTENPDDRDVLESILDARGWTIQGATSIREATRLVQENPNLIVCDSDLSDGTWRDVFREAARLDHPPPVVVVSRHADQKLWAEVLNVGAFDVLLKPFECNEVAQVTGSAFRQTLLPVA